MKIKDEIEWKQQIKEWKMLAKFYRAEKDKYKWLYTVACEILHDTNEVPLEQIKEELEKLWELQNKIWEGNKNVN